MSRKLVCTNCGKGFDYDKRGPTPKQPLCLKCSTAIKKPLATKSKTKKKDVADKVPPPRQEKKSKKPVQAFKYYYDFTGPTEEEKPFEAGEKLYAIPPHYYSDERKHTRGRVVLFHSYTDTPGTVIVEATFHVGGKTVTETVTTKKTRLTRFKKTRIPIEEAVET